jgi:amino acid adenylation domain-containing protein
LSDLRQETIYNLITEQARKIPHQIAIKHNDKQVSYADMDLQTNNLAVFFKANGITYGDVIAIAMDRSIEMSICMLALMKIGATYLPIDPDLPVDRIDFLLKDSASSQIIVSGKYSNAFGYVIPKIDFNEACLNASASIADYISQSNEKEALTYTIYTSGSTGNPKGVSIAHDALLNLLLYRKQALKIIPDDNIIGITSMSFDIAQEELYLPLISGARLTIVDKEVSRDGSALLDVIRIEKITFMQATPYIWQMMIESGWDERLPIRAISGGESLTPDLGKNLLNRCSEVWNMYGPTETTICATAKRIIAHTDITIGKPVNNVRVYILDEKLSELPVGEEGEIFIAGYGVANGYINRPDLTYERFVDDIYGLPGQKMYKTGDLGRIRDDGEILFIGRIDTQIKFRGYRIETEEIEYQLKQHDDIKKAIVTVFQGQLNDSLLIAYILLKNSIKQEDESGWIANLKDDLKRSLPGHMVPTSIVIIPSIPLLPSGKVNLKALPDPNLQNNINDFVAAESQLEIMLIDIWEANIGISNIGVNDNFFDLGGTSLIAVKTKIQIEKKTNKRLSPSVLFKYPTIKQLAVIVGNSSLELHKALVPIKPEGSKIPLYIVHGIGLNVLNFRTLANNMDANQPVYGLQAVVLDQQTTPLNTIESIASFYIDEILANNPTTSFAIAGYSIGGVIAYEMTKQLKALGKQVPILIMFDTAVQIPTHQFPLLKRIFVKSLRQIPKLSFRIRSFMKYPNENISYLKTIYTKKFRELFYGIKDSYGLPEYMEETIAHLKEAFNLYIIQPSDIEIQLFVGKKIYYLDDPKFLGWKKYALRGVKVHNVLSNHDNMFEPPFDKEIARIIQQKLNDINF